MPETLHRFDTALDLRAAAETGSFEGIACVPEVEDAYGTTWAAGCWTAGGLDTRERAYALLHMHDPYIPVGTFTAREDESGLYISGAWDDSTAGRDARARARSGSMPGLSVGARVLAVDPDHPERFTQVRLVEVSQVTARMAAVPGAAFTLARSTAGVDVGGNRLVAVTRARLALARPR